MKRLLLPALAALVIGLVAVILAGVREEPARPADRAPAPAPAARQAPIDAPPRVALPRGRPLLDGAQLLPVRDHRTDAMGEERPDPAILPSTVSAMRPVLLPIVKQCALPLRSQVPVQKGRIVVTTHVKARNGKVSVADVAVRQDMINDPALVDCVTKGFERAALDAPPEQDDGEMDVTMAFPVP